MKCRFPVPIDKNKGEGCRPCGGCLPCTINECRIKTQRIMLESFLHPQNSFLTLTYSDENLPSHGVSVEEHQAFMKAFRTALVKANRPPVRFFMCGEYGDKTARPHYHYAMFNYPTCVGRGAVWINKKYHPCNCVNCSFVADVWGKGHIYNGTLEADSAAYVASYVTKKLTAKDMSFVTPVAFVDGKYVKLKPEFSLSSRRPGLGYGALDALRNSNRPVTHALWHTPQGIFVPRDGQSFKGGKLLPVGRYIKDKLNVEKTTPIQMEISQLRRVYEVTKTTSSYDSIDFISGSLAGALALVNSQGNLIQEGRLNRKRSSYEI